MIAVVTLLVLALTSPQADPQEKPRVPDDSIELTVTGCLKGRVLATVGRRPGEVERGVYVGERTFRVNGNKDVMDEVKKRNKQLVEVVGLVKRSALDDKGVEVGPCRHFRRLPGSRQREHPDRRGQHPGHGRQRDPAAGNVLRRPVEPPIGRVDPVGSGLQTRPTRQLGVPL